MVGDNSCFPATRLRTPNRLAYPFFKLSMLRMTNDEVLMAFHVFLLLSLLLLSPLVAWSTLFAPSWAGAQASREGAPRGSPSAQAAHPTRLSSLLSFFLHLACCESDSSACAALVRSQKPARSRHSHRHARLRLPQPPMSVLREHSSSRSRLGRRRQACPC